MMFMQPQLMNKFYLDQISNNNLKCKILKIDFFLVIYKNYKSFSL